jgi:hypothetical protein
MVRKAVRKLWVNGQLVELVGDGDFVGDPTTGAWTLTAHLDLDLIVAPCAISLLAEDGTRVYGRARVVPSLDDLEVVLEGLERPEVVEP